MNLTFSAEQQLFADSLHRFLENEYAFEHRRALVEKLVWGDPAIWQQLADLGCFGVAVPECAGGFGGGAIEIGIMSRAMGRRMVIEPVVAAAEAGTLLGGTTGADDHIAALIGGTVRFATIHDMSLENNILFGTAQAVTGAVGAGQLLIANNTGLFVTDLTKVASTPVRMTDDTLTADLNFDGARAVRIETGDDWENWRALAKARSQIGRAWQAWGVMEGALAATIEYMRDRRQFRRRLADFQTVQHRVAEMVVATKEAEVAAILGATMLDSKGISDQAVRAIAAANSRIANAGAIVAENAVQLHGGMGVSDELDIAARFRHLRAYRTRVESIDRPIDQYVRTVTATGAHHHSAVLMDA